MPEIRLVKKYPHIKDEDIASIFQEGYIKGFENGKKGAIPIELIKKEMKRLDEDIKWAWYYGNTALDKMEYLKTWLTIKLEDWEKENDQ